ncbi:hypothetical protein B0J13DRAFT_589464 [Dactylonectria estremocensis]|uniref:Rhodopsin domain-containing protein n=1 Tax=Dactylonectria estremocensis TaxID=1079267 RepID=A0A9P9DK49_9HYPO|nr:hypothetical protein B0J13DRAFT_589464 [Dactylonectria estremocensis]
MANAPPSHTQEYLDANKGPVILGVVVTVSSLSTLFVAARLFTRKLIMGAFNLDDWLTIGAVIFEWCCVGVTIFAVKDGNGRHFDTLEVDEQQNAIFYTILGFPFGTFAFGLPKPAVAALLIRIMNPKKIHRIILWALPSLYMGGPYVLVDFAIFAESLSAFTDLYLAAYPAFVLWTLQMNLRKKVALSVALGVGSISTIVAIYKCTRLPALASDDFSYGTSDLVIWTVKLEASTIIIACCIPVLQPLVDFLFGRRTLQSSSGYKNYGTSRTGQHISDMELERSRQSSSNSTSHIRSKPRNAIGSSIEKHNHAGPSHC